MLKNRLLIKLQYRNLEVIYNKLGNCKNKEIFVI